MKKISKFLIVSMLSGFIVFGFVGSTMAATTPDLGEAASFGILSSTYTNTIAGTINGDLGYTTPPATPTTVNGTIYVPKPPQAGIDQGLALAALNAQPCDFNFAIATDLSTLPQPLTPGVYCITAAASIGVGGITLNGIGTYIFRISGALNTLANSVVALAGGASECDIFWTPTATTFGANSTFIGTVIDNNAITVGNNVGILGRLLNFATTVTTNNDTITVPTCSAPATLTVIKHVINNNGSGAETTTTGTTTATATATTTATATPTAAAPSFPKTGILPKKENNLWNIMGVVGIVIVISTSLIIAFKKRII